MASMDSQLLVAAQISSLFPPTSSINCVVHTKQSDVPLLPTSDSEHSTYSELFYHEFTGAILLRVIHDWQVLELVSLSTDAPPIRFIFPATILPNPALLWGSNTLHIIAVTSVGSLFRLVIPLVDGAPVWQATTPNTIQTREYILSKLKSDDRSIVADVQGLYCVALGLGDGSVLRLETDETIEETLDGEQFSMQLIQFLHLNFHRYLAGNAPSS
jgi:hypothetical protein